MLPYDALLQYLSGGCLAGASASNKPHTSPPHPPSHPGMGIIDLEGEANLHVNKSQRPPGSGAGTSRCRDCLADITASLACGGCGLCNSASPAPPAAKPPTVFGIFWPCSIFPGPVARALGADRWLPQERPMTTLRLGSVTCGLVVRKGS